MWVSVSVHVGDVGCVTVYMVGGICKCVRLYVGEFMCVIWVV